MAHILVLDDMEDVVVLIRKILETKGYQVSGFTEEEEAISFAGSQTIDLAIIDMKLKKMSGIEVLEELKKINPLMHAMILTGYPTLESARQALELGADEYCVKPVEIEELEGKVEAILSKDQMKE